jgi:hypothetical protein
MAKRRTPANKRKAVNKKIPSASVRGSARTTSQAHSRATESAQTNRAEVRPNLPTESFRIEGKRSRYTTIIGSVIIIGIISIYLYVGLLLKLRNFYTLLFIIPLYTYVFGDLIRWLWSGIRSVEVDSSGLRIVRSSRQAIQSISTREIGSIRVSSSLDGPVVDVLLHGATAKKFLWMYVL